MSTFNSLTSFTLCNESEFMQRKESDTNITTVQLRGKCPCILLKRTPLLELISSTCSFKYSCKEDKGRRMYIVALSIRSNDSKL